MQQLRYKTYNDYATGQKRTYFDIWRDLQKSAKMIFLTLEMSPILIKISYLLVRGLYVKYI